MTAKTTESYGKRNNRVEIERSVEHKEIFPGHFCEYNADAVIGRVLHCDRGSRSSSRGKLI